MPRQQSAPNKPGDLAVLRSCQDSMVVRKRQAERATEPRPIQKSGAGPGRRVAGEDISRLQQGKSEQQEVANPPSPHGPGKRGSPQNASHVWQEKRNRKFVHVPPRLIRDQWSHLFPSYGCKQCSQRPRHGISTERAMPAARRNMLSRL
jgi:hypothetical protein